MPSLQSELALSVGMAAASTVIHLVGLTVLLRVIRLHIRHLRSPWLALDRVAVPLVMATGLFFLHGLEISGYALLFHRLVGLDIEHALYVSSSAYTTAGLNYFDNRPQWRLVGAMEPLVGMVMLGWSTAFLFSTLRRILTSEENHPLEPGAIAN